MYKMKYLILILVLILYCIGIGIVIGIVEPLRGFEPPTCSLRVSCSTS